MTFEEKQKQTEKYSDTLRAPAEIPEYDEIERQLDDDFWDNYFDNLSPYEID